MPQSYYPSWQMRKRKHREVRWLAQGHTDGKRQNHNLNPSHLTPESWPWYYPDPSEDLLSQIPLGPGANVCTKPAFLRILETSLHHQRLPTPISSWWVSSMADLGSFSFSSYSSPLLNDPLILQSQGHSFLSLPCVSHSIRKHLFIPSLVYSLNKCLLSTYYEPPSVLGAGFQWYTK